MFSVFYRELSAYFKIPTAYFILLVYLVLSMIVTFYMGYYLQLNNFSMISFFSFQPQVLANIVPAITMKLWADERKSGTIEFILTQPVSYVSVVTAKFLAAFCMGAVLLVSTFPLWIWTASVISVDNHAILSSYLGCFFIVAVFCAVGCLISSLTKNIITAYLVSVFVCWIITYINLAFGSGIGVSNLLWSKIVQSLNFFKHYQDMISGQIGLDNVIYFVSFTVLLLWANKVVVEYKKD